jgi:hypothetical protein
LNHENEQMNKNIISLIGLLKLKDEKLNLVNKNIDVLKDCYTVKLYVINIIKKHLCRSRGFSTLALKSCFNKWRVGNIDSQHLTLNIDLQKQNEKLLETISLEKQRYESLKTEVYTFNNSLKMISSSR